MSDHYYYSPPKTPVTNETEAIHALTTEYEQPGWLSTLVWNIRNNYLAWPEGKTNNCTVRMIVEGFLAELAKREGPSLEPTDDLPRPVREFLARPSEEGYDEYH